MKIRRVESRLDARAAIIQLQSEDVDRLNAMLSISTGGARVAPAGRGAR